MQKIESRLTIYFERPFWIGVYERVSGGLLEVCKITFGAEPKDHEVYEYLLQNWHLLRFSPSVKVGETNQARVNPKRMQREITKQLDNHGIGTKCFEATTRGEYYYP